MKEIRFGKGRKIVDYIIKSRSEYLDISAFVIMYYKISFAFFDTLTDFLQNACYRIQFHKISIKGFT
jgi:hypothetical protein